MSTTLNDIISRLNDRRRDTTANSIDMTANGFRAINDVLDIWQTSHDWEFTLQKQTINFNKNITEYPVASDTKAPINMYFLKKPMINSMDFEMVSQSGFPLRTIYPNRFAMKTVGQVKTIRIETSGNTSQINTMNSLTGNGTITSDGTVITALAQDSYESYWLPASLSFNYSGTSGTITCTGQPAVNLQAYLNRSNLYFNIYLPVVTNFSSVTLQWGSSSSNYYTATVTADFLGNALLASTWTTLKFPWVNATTVGTPDPTNMSYWQVTIAYSGSETFSGGRIEDLFVSENVPLVLEYYSNNMVQAASTGTQTGRFQNASNTTDFPLWSGDWDWVTDSFVESVMELLNWITGEYDDMNVATARIEKIVEEKLKTRLPSRRRQQETFLNFGTNFPRQWPNTQGPYRRF
jgi:hypothetical protein